MVTIVLNDNGAQSELRELAGRIENPQALLKVLGRRGSNELINWFRQRNQTPNKLGGRRSNFWRKIADSVTNPDTPNVQGGKVIVSVTDSRFAQKVFGGPITPKEAGALVEELKDFHRKVSEAGRASFNARSGAHDDLVLACAIAVWFATNAPVSSQEPLNI